jgi:hypothetical protein
MLAKVHKYEIEDGVPIPGTPVCEPTWQRFPFDKMQVGQSFAIPVGNSLPKRTSAPNTLGYLCPTFSLRPRATIPSFCSPY